MYRDILRQIANTIFVNVQHQEKLGLLDGKVGISLFFYSYARYTNNKIYSELAGELIDQVYEGLDKYVDRNFFSGLTGIAYGIDYAIKNKFVETDESDGDILEDIDTDLSSIDENTFLLELESNLPLFSKGLYFLHRNDKYALSKITEECLVFLLNYDRDLPLSYINSILYFINNVLLSEILDRDILYKILDILFTQTSRILLGENCDEPDRYTLSINILNIQQQKIKEKWLRLPVDYNNESVDLLDKSWVHFVYKYGNGEDWPLDKSTIQELLKNIIQDLTQKDLVLYKGLSGLGLELIRLSK